jgi:hypothetical protein
MVHRNSDRSRAGMEIAPGRWFNIGVHASEIPNLKSQIV